MPLRRIAVAAIPLLCGLECALAAPRWLKLSSASFELFTTAGERRGCDAILYFEQVRGFFLKATHASGGSALPVRIVAFSSDKEYKPCRATETAAAGRTRQVTIVCEPKVDGELGTIGVVRSMEFK
ncbi:MAG: hypothetical protein ABSE56_17205 [Bryobacteraceae bacterium]|jgi:hypothetical protein